MIFFHHKMFLPGEDKSPIPVHPPAKHVSCPVCPHCTINISSGKGWEPVQYEGCVAPALTRRTESFWFLLFDSAPP